MSKLYQKQICKLRCESVAYHPCTSILIEGLKRLPGGSAILAEWDKARSKVDAPQPAVPVRGEPVAGYTMVPVEPTPQMIAAFRSGFQNELHKNDRRRTMSAEEAGLRAMLKATPQPAEPVKVPSVGIEAACPDNIRALLAERDALREALTELCDEIDKHEIHAAISQTSISWFKRKARAAL